MPLTNTAQSICGPMPAPNTLAFLNWINNYISKRKNYCMF